MECTKGKAVLLSYSSNPGYELHNYVELQLQGKHKHTTWTGQIDSFPRLHGIFQVLYTMPESLFPVFKSLGAYVDKVHYRIANVCTLKKLKISSHLCLCADGTAGFLYCWYEN